MEVCGGGDSCGRMHLARFLGNPAAREEGLLAALGTFRAQEEVWQLALSRMLGSLSGSSPRASLWVKGGAQAQRLLNILEALSELCPEPIWALLASPSPQGILNPRDLTLGDPHSWDPHSGDPRPDPRGPSV